MSQTLGWGIIGPGTIAQNFADGLAEVPEGHLAAIASRDASRRAAFGDRHGVPAAGRHDSYEALVADPSVDAVYVATPHPFHLPHGLMVLRAGRALMLEKPAGLNAAQVATLVDAAAEAGVFFMEAYKCRCHPQMGMAADMIRAGRIGTPRRIEASYGFTATRDPASRLFAPTLAGGAILDIGGYTLAAARLMAGAAQGLPFAEPLRLTGNRQIGPTGVDEVSRATLDFAGGLVADVACAIVEDMPNTLRIEGSAGTITLPDPWSPGRNAGPSDAAILLETPDGGTERIDYRDPRHLFAYEVGVATRAILSGATRAPAPAMTPEDSLGNARAADLWLACPAR